MSTINDLVARHGDNKDALIAVLTEREDTMREALFGAGAQFGLMPFIVAEVLAQVGLGSPPSEEERALIRANFVTGMNAIREGRDPRTPPTD